MNCASPTPAGDFQSRNHPREVIDRVLCSTTLLETLSAAERAVAKLVEQGAGQDDAQGGDTVCRIGQQSSMGNSVGHGLADLSECDLQLGLKENLLRSFGLLLNWLLPAQASGKYKR